MAVPTSQDSVASSQGSKTYDAPRKRREFPRRLRPGFPRPPLSTGSQSSASKQHTGSQSSASKQHASSQLSSKKISPGSQSSSARPPPSPRPKSTAKPISTRRRSRSPRSGSTGSSDRSSPRTSPQALQMQRSRSSPRLSPRLSPRPSPRSSPAPSPAPSPRASPKTVPARPPMIPPSPSSRSVKSMLSRARSYSKSSNVSVEPKQDMSGRTTFHVRVSLGYLTGIKVEQLSKRQKKGNQNMLIVGYASLAKSGKQIALSQPLLPNIGETKPRSLKLCWAKQKGKAEIGGNSKAKRRLHFSVKLEKETDQGSRADDDSFSSQTTFNPEVVKLEIGLKCGEEKFPLGIANLVVNGKEVSEHKIDMSVRPINESFSQQKSRLGIFGSGKKQQSISFSNDDQSYRIASNSTLRVRVDMKAGIPGESKATVWGDGDDASYATNWSFDTRGTMASLSRSTAAQSQQMTIGSAFASRHPMPGQELPRPSRAGENNSFARSFNSEWAEASPDLNGVHIIGSQTPHKVLRCRVPLRYVIIQPNSDGRSLTSGLTSPEGRFAMSFFMTSCFPMNICGDHTETRGGRRGERGLGRESGRGRGRTTKGLSIESGDKEDEDPSWNDKTDLPEMVSSDSGSETSGSEDDIIVENQKMNTGSQGGSKKNLWKEAVDFKETKKPSVHGDVEDAETVDITVETYTDLKGAQATLLRYANKVGIRMEDLLESMEKS